MPSEGGYSHSFFNDNAFDIHAYGEIITQGGGTTQNSDDFARNTLSHNGLLVDGRGQYQPIHYPCSKRVGREQQLANTRVDYIAAYEETDDYTYWVGDASKAYFESVPKSRRNAIGRPSSFATRSTAPM